MINRFNVFKINGICLFLLFIIFYGCCKNKWLLFVYGYKFVMCDKVYYLII